MGSLSQLRAILPMFITSLGPSKNKEATPKNLSPSTALKNLNRGTALTNLNRITALENLNRSVIALVFSAPQLW